MDKEFYVDLSQNELINIDGGSEISYNAGYRLGHAIKTVLNFYSAYTAFKLLFRL